jgi:hypothetical protein
LRRPDANGLEFEFQNGALHARRGDEARNRLGGLLTTNMIGLYGETVG